MDTERQQQECEERRYYTERVVGPWTQAEWDAHKQRVRELDRLIEQILTNISRGLS